MFRMMMVLFVGILAIFFGIAQAEDNITVKSMPPVVVKTFPQAGSIAVDPSVKEIRVTFSKEMIIQDMWSWVMISKKSFPQIVGEVRYLNDKRTCVAPVNLEPGKTYAFWLNSEKYNAFRDKENNPAVPYLLVFQTSE
jgi:Bacterial Ig-like domain